MRALNLLHLTIFCVGTSGHLLRNRWSSVSVPSTAPSAAAGPVSSSYIGFAFEEASAVAYAAGKDGTGNQFSFNLMQGLLNRTGGTPIVRVGGTSGDYALYIANQTEPALPISTYNQGHVVGNTTIGPNYFPAIKLFATGAGAKLVPNLPLAFLDANITIEWALAMQSGLELENVLAIEIGNEPNAYNGKVVEGQPTQPNLNVTQYAGVYQERAKLIANALDLPPGQPIFQAFDTAWADTRDDNNSFAVQGGFEAGIDSFGMISRVAHHYYQVQCKAGLDPTTALRQQMMNHTVISQDVGALQPQIDYCNNDNPPPQGASGPLGFYLTEIGNSIGCNSTTLSQTFGSALWIIDFSLQAMSRGVAGLNFQQIFGTAYDLWNPYQSSPKAPPSQVYPQYYALNLVADFIGQYGPKVVEVNTSVDGVSMYAAYDNCTLSHIAVVNLNFWTPNEGSRPTTNVTLSLPNSTNQVTKTTLRGPDGAEGTAVYYAGSTWSNSTGMEQMDQDTESSATVLEVQENGEVTLSLEASSAALLSLS